MILFYFWTLPNANGGTGLEIIQFMFKFAHRIQNCHYPGFTRNFLIFGMKSCVVLNLTSHCKTKRRELVAFS